MSQFHIVRHYSEQTTEAEPTILLDLGDRTSVNPEQSR